MKQDAQKIADYGTYLGAEAAYNLTAVKDYAIRNGLQADYIDPHTAGGFILKPFFDAIAQVATPGVDRVFHAGEWGMAELGDAFLGAARSIGHIEQSNEHLFYSFHLDGDHPEQTPGKDNYSGDGTAFPIAKLDLPKPPPPPRGDDDLDLKGTAAKIETVVNWLIEKVNEYAPKLGLDSPFKEGDTFESLIIDPILGNFNAINCYGTAWKTVFNDGIGAIVVQMGKNMTTLVGNEATEDAPDAYWTGEGAAAAKAFFDAYWDKGVHVAATAIGDAIAKGYEKISGVLSDIASRLVSAVGDLLNHIGNFLVKYMADSPVAGAVEAGGELLANMFWDDEVETIVERIKNVIKVIGEIIDAYNKMKAVIEAANEYWHAIVEFAESLEQFPKISDVQSAGDFATRVGAAGKNLPGGEKFEKLEQGGGAVAEAGKKYNEADQELQKAKERYPQNKAPAKPKREDYDGPLAGPYRNPKTGKYESGAYRNKKTGQIVFESDFG